MGWYTSHLRAAVPYAHLNCIATIVRTVDDSCNSVNYTLFCHHSLTFVSSLYHTSYTATISHTCMHRSRVSITSHASHDHITCIDNIICIDHVTSIDHIARITWSRHKYRSHHVHRSHHTHHMIASHVSITSCASIASHVPHALIASHICMHWSHQMIASHVSITSYSSIAYIHASIASHASMLMFTIGFNTHDCLHRVDARSDDLNKK